jgi:hypothetical protein
MIVRISQTHPFRLAFDTTVVEGGGNDDVAEVAETVAEAVADAVEDVAEAVADAVSDATTDGIPAEWVERIVKLEIAVEEIGLAVARNEGTALAALSSADAAVEIAEDATTPAEVEAMIEETTIEDTDGDGKADAIDAPDEPPAGVGKSILFATPREVKERFFRKDRD